MSINLGNVPMSVTYGPMEADPAADTTVNWFRFPREGRVLACYAVNDAAIAAATNTLAVQVGSRSTTGTNALTTIASMAVATWAADTPKTLTMVAANQDVAEGTWIAVFRNEEGTGTQTRLMVQMDYMLATGATTA